MNHFSHNPLNRFSEIRPDEQQMQALWKHERVRVLVVHGTMSLLEQQPGGRQAAILGRKAATMLAEQAAAAVYLGSEGEVPYFALGFEGATDAFMQYVGAAYTLADLRTTAAELSPTDGALLAYARGMVYWNLRHRFCPNCSSPTRSASAGHVRECVNPECNTHHFPRTDTAIIVLISEGDACLLGRQAVWPTGMYATIAGFLEPGETLEQAVAREAQEETGVSLQEITYHSSQPWPFPSSIMVGFQATAADRKLQVDNQELEDARWFTREEIAAGLQDESLRLPPSISISYRLIQDWYDAALGYELAALTGC
ncbi:NAD(+) diphosphatase [Pontibacter sp. CAU 1760]